MGTIGGTLELENRTFTNILEIGTCEEGNIPMFYNRGYFRI